MDPSVVEFLAEDQMVNIVPSFSCDRVFLICGEVGPFRAGLPVKVPIWLALNLRQRQKCRVLPPDWMNVEQLLQAKEEESQSRFFNKMPSEHYMVEGRLLLGIAAEDIPQADEIRTILKDIWDIRMSKLRSSIDAFIKTGGTHAKLDHLTDMEINSIRPLLPHALDEMFSLQRVTSQPLHEETEEFSQETQ
ncbi:probable DNA replication complex GINS protein PSF2 [Periplaneta americana]|uniref:probable DNA replication complex GINS protein PSF2 n=1 Tax=Periplaneta americana TaxID=6978 RepID=UPI0037E95C36